MDERKFAKVLALAASDNDMEALHALRAARRMLETQGTTFLDLASRMERELGAPIEAHVLQETIFNLRNEIRDLRSENQRLRQGREPVFIKTGEVSEGGGEDSQKIAIIARLRSEVTDLTQTIAAQRAEAERLTAAWHVQAEGVRSDLIKAKQRITDLDGRRGRLEAENRRLTYANHALTVEVNELKKGQATRTGVGETG